MVNKHWIVIKTVNYIVSMLISSLLVILSLSSTQALLRPRSTEKRCKSAGTEEALHPLHPLKRTILTGPVTVNRVRQQHLIKYKSFWASALYLIWGLTNMFGLKCWTLLILLFVVVLFGGRRLPELGSALGKGIRDSKTALKAKIKKTNFQKPKTYLSRLNISRSSLCRKFGVSSSSSQSY